MKVRYVDHHIEDVVEREVDAQEISLEGNMVIFKSARDGVLLMLPQHRLVDAFEEPTDG